MSALPHTLIPVTEVSRRIMEAVSPIGTVEQLPLRSALGRVLAKDVVSGFQVPPADNSAMDGYAVKWADLPASQEQEVALTVVGTTLAGAPWSGQLGSGQSVRIMTGGVIPCGADTVVMQEQARREGNRVWLGGGHPQGDNVRRAGDDLVVGQTVLQAGRRLHGADLGLLASLGIAEVGVYRRPRIAFFTTGDELRSPGESLEEGQIYDSNRYTLYGLLTHLGVELLDLGAIPDEPKVLEEALIQGGQAADGIIASGGVSVGEADHIRSVLAKRGRVELWRIAMKPGKPLAFGWIGTTLFFGLPGNPVSTMVTFLQFVRPALVKLAGESPRAPWRLQARCSDNLKKKPGRTDFQRGLLSMDDQGQWQVRSTGDQGSHILTSMSQANCFIVLPQEGGNVASGSLVEVELFPV